MIIFIPIIIVIVLIFSKKDDEKQNIVAQTIKEIPLNYLDCFYRENTRYEVLYTCGIKGENMIVLSFSELIELTKQPINMSSEIHLNNLSLSLKYSKEYNCVFPPMKVYRFQNYIKNFLSDNVLDYCLLNSKKLVQKLNL